MKSKKRKVAVAMSGGVDSSVAAALLKKQGYEVIGVFCYFWSDSKTPTPNKCCSLEALKSARAVASTLGISLHTLNFKAEFKKEVVDYFVNEYLSGRTPNPCVVCNKVIKFGKLLSEAKKLGCDYLATGHYARITKSLELGAQGSMLEAQSYHRLLKGIDEKKDQSYFLWQLNQEQLKHIVFPIGDYRKEEVRKLAKKFNLPVYRRPESQEICFVDTDYRKFLKTRINTDKKHGLILIRKGNIIDERGNILGEHRGLPFYTIGQRAGLGISASKPLYVIDLDVKSNIVVVGREKDLYSKELTVNDVNWISGILPKFPLRCFAKIRYGMEEQLAVVSSQSSVDRYKVIFDKPIRAITPGQSIVFYDDVEILGGGVIESKSRTKN